jgi:DNA mismatch repair protein MutL
MPPIQVLPSDLVNQIAAGEVVERPASVVKELIENSIDADATTIDILLEGGGRKLIEVRDDGCGMSHDDAALAVERHATSKIREFGDLTRVRTLGFRGEALPSIASVSRFTLTTFDGTSDTALEIDCDPLTGTRTVRPAARDRGTTVRVAELFENVPARRKFLRSADAEFRFITTVVSSYALPLPSRAFRLEHNGRVVLDLPPAPDARERVVQIIGSDAAGYLVPIEGELASTRAGGFVTRGLRLLMPRTAPASRSISTVIRRSSSSSRSLRSWSTSTSIPPRPKCGFVTLLMCMCWSSRRSSARSAVRRRDRRYCVTLP